MKQWIGRELDCIAQIYAAPTLQCRQQLCLAPRARHDLTMLVKTQTCLMHTLRKHFWNCKRALIRAGHSFMHPNSSSRVKSVAECAGAACTG